MAVEGQPYKQQSIFEIGSVVGFCRAVPDLAAEGVGLGTIAYLQYLGMLIYGGKCTSPNPCDTCLIGIKANTLNIK